MLQFEVTAILVGSGVSKTSDKINKRIPCSSRTPEPYIFVIKYIMREGDPKGRSADDKECVNLF